MTSTGFRDLKLHFFYVSFFKVANNNVLMNSELNNVLHTHTHKHTGSFILSFILRVVRIQIFDQVLQCDKDVSKECTDPNNIKVNK